MNTNALVLFIIQLINERKIIKSIINLHIRKITSKLFKINTINEKKYKKLNIFLIYLAYFDFLNSK